MSRSVFRLAIASMFCCLALVVAASAQDFQKSYRIGAGGSIRIANISGDVTVTGYDGDSILVSGFKEGRDRDKVQVKDNSSGNNVEIGVHYPEHCNCNASIKFQVQVPRSVSYAFDQISSVSGNVEVSDVTGNLRASSVSGDVDVKDVTGVASASSVSGDVKVEIMRLDGGDSMEFSSVSGDVEVKVPSGIDANVNMSSFSGSIKSDFAVETNEKRNGPGRWARARLGDGSRSLRMSSVSGSLNLKRF